MIDVGVYRTAELRQGGLRKSEIDTAVALGSLVRVRHGWLSTTSANPDAVSAVQQGGALSCISALALYGVWVPPTGRIHVRQPQHRRGAHPTACRPSGVNPPVKAAVDDLETSFRAAASCLDAESLVVVMDSLLYRRLATRADLRGWLHEAPRRIRRLVNRTDLAESGTETMVRIRMRRRGVRVRTQVWVTYNRRVDMLIGDRLIVECDSREHHTSREAYEADRRRDRELAAMGYLVVRLTYRQVLYEWESVEADLLQLVRDGAHLWPRRERQISH